jgi:hypothetical protein
MKLLRFCKVMTTATVAESDIHVKTQYQKLNPVSAGKYIVLLNSLTNLTFSVIFALEL